MDSIKMLNRLGVSPFQRRVAKLDAFLERHPKCRLIIDEYVPHPASCYLYAHYEPIAMINECDNRVFAVVDRPASDKKYILRAEKIVGEALGDITRRYIARYVNVVIDYCREVGTNKVYIGEGGKILEGDLHLLVNDNVRFYATTRTVAKNGEKLYGL